MIALLLPAEWILPAGYFFFVSISRMSSCLLTMISVLPLYSFSTPVTQMAWLVYSSSGDSIKPALSLANITMVSGALGYLAPTFRKVTLSVVFTPNTSLHMVTFSPMCWVTESMEMVVCADAMAIVHRDKRESRIFFMGQR